MGSAAAAQPDIEAPGQDQGEPGEHEAQGRPGDRVLQRPSVELWHAMDQAEREGRRQEDHQRMENPPAARQVIARQREQRRHGDHAEGDQDEQDAHGGFRLNGSAADLARAAPGSSRERPCAQPILSLARPPAA